MYVINDPPCNSAYAAKGLNIRSLLLFGAHDGQSPCNQIWKFLHHQIPESRLN